MSYLHRSGLVVASIALWLATPTTASAIPIIFGHGETISHVKDLPGDLKQQARAELNQDVAIGFKYSHLHVFWLDVWSWDGEFVLYHDKQFWKLTQDQWTRFLGREGYEALEKPLLYRFPIGLVVVAALIIWSIVYKWITRKRTDQATQLLQDPRYQEAVRLYGEKLTAAQNPSPGGPLDMTEKPEAAAFAAALDYLQKEGVPPDEAKANLVRVLSFAGMPAKPEGAT